MPIAGILITSILTIEILIDYDTMASFLLFWL